MKALIDGDILVYKCGFACEKLLYYRVYFTSFREGFMCNLPEGLSRKEVTEYVKSRWSKEIVGKVKPIYQLEPIEHALYLTKNLIKKILDDTQCDEYRVYLSASDKSNFRYNVATIKPYKGHRAKMKKPFHYQDIVDYLIKYHKAIVIFGEEADDAMGKDHAEDTVICTTDKDMRQLPGKFYNLDWRQKGLQMIEDIPELGYLSLTKGEKYSLIGGGLMWFYAQMLLGDSADNIPGIPRMGVVSTYNALKDCKTEKEMQDVVLSKYKKHYKEKYKEALKEIKQLLWIRR